MGRVPRIVRPFVESLDDLRVLSGSTSARAVAATVRQIAEAPELPLPGDVEGPLPLEHANRIERAEGRRLLTAFARRVRGQALWVWYRPRGPNRVDLVAVTRSPA